MIIRVPHAHEALFQTVQKPFSEECGDITPSAHAQNHFFSPRMIIPSPPEMSIRLIENCFFNSLYRIHTCRNLSRTPHIHEIYSCSITDRSSFFPSDRNLNSILSWEIDRFGYYCQFFEQISLKILVLRVFGDKIREK